MARYTWQAKILHPIFGCSYMHLLKSALIKFSREKVLRWAEQQVKGQMVKSENTENMNEYILHAFACVFRKMIWIQAIPLPLHCWWRLTRRITVNSRAPEISICLYTYLRARPSSQRCKPLICGHSASSSAGLPSPWTNGVHIGATKLVWTAVILNDSETRGPLYKRKGT